MSKPQGNRKLRDELLLKSEDNSKKEEKRKKKMSDERRKLDAMREASLREQAQDLTTSLKGKKKQGQSQLDEFAWRESTNNVTVTVGSENNKNDSSRDYWGIDTWDDSGVTVSMSARGMSGDDIWDDTPDTSIEQQTRVADSKTYDSKSYQKPRTFCNSKNSRGGNNQAQSKNKQLVSKENRRGRGRGTSDFHHNNKRGRGSKSDRSEKSDQYEWKPQHSWMPDVVDAPAPQVNVWEQRQSKREELEQLLPNTVHEEDAMIQKAIELSRYEALHERRLQGNLSKIYSIQEQSISENPRLLEDLINVERIDTSRSNTMKNFQLMPSDEVDEEKTVGGDSRSFSPDLEHLSDAKQNRGTVASTDFKYCSYQDTSWEEVQQNKNASTSMSRRDQCWNEKTSVRSEDMGWRDLQSPSKTSLSLHKKQSNLKKNNDDVWGDIPTVTPNFSPNFKSRMKNYEEHWDNLGKSPSEKEKFNKASNLKKDHKHQASVARHSKNYDTESQDSKSWNDPSEDECLRDFKKTKLLSGQQPERDSQYKKSYPNEELHLKKSFNVGQSVYLNKECTGWTSSEVTNLHETDKELKVIAQQDYHDEDKNLLASTHSSFFANNQQQQNDDASPSDSFQQSYSKSNQATAFVEPEQDSWNGKEEVEDVIKAVDKVHLSSVRNSDVDLDCIPLSSASIENSDGSIRNPLTEKALSSLNESNTKDVMSNVQEWLAATQKEPHPTKHYEDDSSKSEHKIESKYPLEAVSFPANHFETADKDEPSIKPPTYKADANSHVPIVPNSLLDGTSMQEYPPTALNYGQPFITQPHMMHGVPSQMVNQGPSASYLWQQAMLYSNPFLQQLHALQMFYVSSGVPVQNEFFPGQPTLLTPTNVAHQMPYPGGFYPLQPPVSGCNLPNFPTMSSSEPYTSQLNSFQGIPVSSSQILAAPEVQQSSPCHLPPGIDTTYFQQGSMEVGAPINMPEPVSFQDSNGGGEDFASIPPPRPAGRRNREMGNLRQPRHKFHDFYPQTSDETPNPSIP